MDEGGNLTNAGALLADESPIRYSRVFCTRWNGLDKAHGLMDALDDEEYSGGLVNFLQDSVKFVARNTRKAWRKTGHGRIEIFNRLNYMDRRGSGFKKNLNYGYMFEEENMRTSEQNKRTSGRVNKASEQANKRVSKQTSERMQVIRK